MPTRRHSLRARRLKSTRFSHAPTRMAPNHALRVCRNSKDHRARDPYHSDTRRHSVIGLEPMCAPREPLQQQRNGPRRCGKPRTAESEAGASECHRCAREEHLHPYLRVCHRTLSRRTSRSPVGFLVSSSENARSLSTGTCAAGIARRPQWLPLKFLAEGATTIVFWNVIVMASVRD